MLFVLNIDELVIIYIILNYQINKLVICVILCHSITNWVVFQFIIILTHLLFVSCPS